MKKLCLIFALVLSLTENARSQNSIELHDTAKLYMRQGNYNNAVLFLKKALEISPTNPGIINDLALIYYFQKENIKGLDIIKPFLDKPEADAQSFQIAGNIYKALDQPKEAEAMYKKALKKFSDSGELYSEYGSLLSSQQNASAINQWERGIEMDPGYSGNYYNAARYYYFTTDKIWSIIYAEIFISIDPLSARTPEVKGILLDSYKKLFSDDLLKNGKGKNNFELAFLQSMNQARSIAENGVNVESLVMIRTRFILDWFEKYATKFPVKLFEHHRQLLREGLFPAYNQWIFGAIQNLMVFQNWVTAHSSEYSDFNNFQKSRIFKVPQGQYYHK